MPAVTIKWGKKKFEDVELALDGTVADFRETLKALTGVPTARQKLMCRGAWKGMLKDDTDLSTVKIAAGAVVKLIGTAEAVVEAPKVATVFVEDMSASEIARAGVSLPPGLNNLGNTCYMNSTLQALRVIPELFEALSAHDASTAEPGDGDALLVSFLRDLFLEMRSSSGAVTPGMFVQVLRRAVPRFAEQQRGMFMQQDADEFLSELLQRLAGKLTSPVSLPSLGDAGNTIDALFGVDYEVEFKCVESEEVELRSERSRKLICNIRGGAGSEEKVDHVMDGIKLGMTQEVEKFSDALGRNALWRKSLRIRRLPRYLCVQFMRFYWKATPDSRDHEGVKCKMLRAITFPTAIDVFDLCSEGLQQRLSVHRRAEADDLLDRPAAPVDDAAAGGGGSGAAADDSAEALAAALALSMGDAGAAAAAAAAASAAGEGDGKLKEEDDGVVSAFDDAIGIGMPGVFKGNYELLSVVTHKGRSADSGHYIGWTRNEGDSWFCFDDELVEECTTEDVMKLKGGGDYDMTYLAFYRYRD